MFANKLREYCFNLVRHKTYGWEVGDERILNLLNPIPLVHVKWANLCNLLYILFESRIGEKGCNGRYCTYCVLGLGYIGLLLGNDTLSASLTDLGL